MFFFLLLLLFVRCSSALIINVDRRFYVLMPIIVIKFIVPKNASIFFKDWEIYQPQHFYWTAVVLNTTALSRYYSIKWKLLRTHIESVVRLCWFYFESLKCYCFGSARVFFPVTYCFCCSCSCCCCCFTRLFYPGLPWLSIRWSTVIGLWLRAPFYNELTITSQSPHCSQWLLVAIQYARSLSLCWAAFLTAIHLKTYLDAFSHESLMF